jgi:hypothetical protein
LLSDPEEAYPEKIKTVVSPTDYGKEELEQGKTFYINNDIKGEERVEYARILKEYSDVLAWVTTDLEGIPAELGEHSIDLQEGVVPVQQRQYRLNPRQGCHADVFRRTDGRTDGRSDDAREGVRYLDTL